VDAPLLPALPEPPLVPAGLPAAPEEPTPPPLPDEEPLAGAVDAASTGETLGTESSVWGLQAVSTMNNPDKHFPKVIDRFRD
jgi:hypothetical protein